MIQLRFKIVAIPVPFVRVIAVGAGTIPDRGAFDAVERPEDGVRMFHGIPGRATLEVVQRSGASFRRHKPPASHTWRSRHGNIPLCPVRHFFRTQFVFHISIILCVTPDASRKGPPQIVVELLLKSVVGIRGREAH